MAAQTLASQTLASKIRATQTGGGATESGTWQTELHHALQDKPWLLGYANAAQPSFAASATVTGNWPQGLQGIFYRNGPGRHEIGAYRYRHWFDGDGLMQAYRITDGTVKHQAEFVQTTKYLEETDAGRALYPGFGSIPPNPSPVTRPDAVNVANISVLHHHEKLFALWEAGSPYELDATTLQTKGAYAFSQQADGVPFSAHPRVEANGHLWNFGYFSAANLMILWHIDPQGRLVKMGKIEVNPITMVHDFIVSAKHIVILVAPFNYNPDNRGDSFLDAHTWQGDEATRVVVVDKNDFSNHYQLELPAQWVFHFGNGWEDSAGVIRFDAARADNPLVIIDTFREIMRGRTSAPLSSQHYQYQIDTKARQISEAPLLAPIVDSEFPSVDPRVSCRQNRLLTMLTSNTTKPTPHGGLSEVSILDIDSGERSSYRYPDTQIPEEHIYVPNLQSGAEGADWVVGTALDWRAKKNILNVFDSRKVSDGPIATATLPYALPLGLHGKFVHG